MPRIWRHGVALRLIRRLRRSLAWLWLVGRDGPGFFPAAAGILGREGSFLPPLEALGAGVASGRILRAATTPKTPDEVDHRRHDDRKHRDILPDTLHGSYPPIHVPAWYVTRAPR